MLIVVLNSEYCNPNVCRAVSPVVGGIEDVISGVSMATSPIGMCKTSYLLLHVLIRQF